mmetsp:Transcript_10892/g.19401  ORF Transcript_10892/g.19401 Transcript_10892/m.19401 type:complete len:218 (+) Transcript_10892:494-1147(+)
MGAPVARSSKTSLPAVPTSARCPSALRHTDRTPCASEDVFSTSSTASAVSAGSQILTLPSRPPESSCRCATAKYSVETERTCALTARLQLRPCQTISRPLTEPEYRAPSRPPWARQTMVSSTGYLPPRMPFFLAQAAARPSPRVQKNMCLSPQEARTELLPPNAQRQSRTFWGPHLALNTSCRLRQSYMARLLLLSRPIEASSWPSELKSRYCTARS